MSRIEDPDYGKLSLQTLFDLAAAFDVPLLVQFVEWEDWLGRMENVSTDALQKESFNGDGLAALSKGQFVIDPIDYERIFKSYQWDFGGAASGILDIGVTENSLNKRSIFQTYHTDQPIMMRPQRRWTALLGLDEEEEDGDLELHPIEDMEHIDIDYGR